VAMLLKNEIVELGLKNGCIGFVKDIVYKENTGPRGPESFKMHPACVTVHFPDLSQRKTKLYQDGPVPIYRLFHNIMKGVITTVVPPFKYRCIRTKLLQYISINANPWVPMKYGKILLWNLWLPYVTIKHQAWNASLFLEQQL
jgi:hypothetical protein